MPTTNGQLYAMMYGGQNTDLVSLYLSTLSSTSPFDERRIADEIKWLTKEQARYRRDLQDLRTAGGEKEQLYKTLRDYRREQRVLLRAQAQYEQKLYELQRKGISEKITVAELKQEEQAKVDKLYELPSSARREILDIVSDAEYSMSGANAAASLNDLIANKAVYKGLPAEQLQVYISALSDQLENLRARKEATVPDFPLAGTEGRETVRGILLENSNASAIQTNAQLQAEQNLKKAEARAIYEGLADTDVFQKEGSGEASTRIATELRKIRREIGKTEKAIGATKIDEAEKILSSDPMQGYLADVRDDYLLNQSAGSYDTEQAEIQRRDLEQIVEREPALIDIQTQQLLDPAFVQREYTLQQARARRAAPSAPQDPMGFLLGAPRLTPFSPAGEVQQFISDLKSGIKKEELRAQLIAEQNPDSAFGQAWLQAPPEQKVLLSLIPSAATRAGRALSANTEIERKAQQAIDVAGGAANMDAANIMRLAKELTDSKKAQAEFATFILASQRQKQVAPSEITTTMAEDITKAEKKADAADADAADADMFLSAKDLATKERAAAFEMLSAPPPSDQLLGTSMDVPF